MRGKAGEITKLETTKRSEKAPLLYDLTTLQREANTRYGFSARRTLAAAQRLYEEHKALTYPRTNSRFLPSDMGGEIKPIAGHLGHHREYAKAAAYVTGLDVLPTNRVINDAKVTDHHAIIPTNSDHKLDKMSDDDRRVYDMVARRFLAVFHPEAVFENTRLETTVEAHVFRTTGRVLLVAGWRGVYGEEALASGAQSSSDDDEGGPQQLPKLERGEAVDTREVAAEEKVTKPPRRYSDASLLAAMETAGKLVDDDELREAMKDSGIGTPATRAAIIERLIDVGYVERDGRSLVATEKGLNVIRLLDEHPLTSPSLTGDWESRLGKIEHGEEPREDFMRDIALFAGETVHDARRAAQGRAHPAREPRPVPGLRPRHRREPQGLLVLVARGPGLRLRDLEVQGRQDAPDRGRARADLHGTHRAPRHGLQGPLRPLLPLPAGADADRGRQVARRVRRAVGARGRQAARGRGGREPRRQRAADGGERGPGRVGCLDLRLALRPPGARRPERRRSAAAAGRSATATAWRCPGRGRRTARRRGWRGAGGALLAHDGLDLGGAGAGLERPGHVEVRTGDRRGDVGRRGRGPRRCGRWAGRGAAWWPPWALGLSVPSIGVTTASLTT